MLASRGWARAAALAAALSWAVTATAADWRVTTRLESDTAWRLRTPRGLQKSQNRAEVELELRLSRAFEMRALGRLLFDPVGRLVGADPDLGASPVDRWQVGGSRHTEAELRELALDWHGRLGPARIDLRLGRQQVVWGQSFGLRVLDIVNPQDFREFILDDFVDARTPLFGLRADAVWRGLSFQVLWFPDFEPDVLADPESEFALDPRHPGLLPALAPFPAVPGSDGPAPAVLLDSPEVPSDWDLSSWAWGLRVGGHAAGVDAAVYYFDRRDPRPAFSRRIELQRVPGGAEVPVNRIRARHPRVRTLGFSLATTFGDFALWGEGGLTAGRAFASRKLGDRDGLVERTELQLALGLDWTGWDRLFANAQFLEFAVLDHDDSVAVDELRSFVSLLLRFDLLEETLFPQLFVLYGLNERDAMWRPSIEWKLNDRLSLTAGADLFTGNRRGLLGQFAARRDCVPVPSALPLPNSGGCLFDPPPGRTSRLFLRLRYAFGWGGS